MLSKAVEKLACKKETVTTVSQQFVVVAAVVAFFFSAENVFVLKSRCSE